MKQTLISPLRRGSKGFLSAEDPLSNACKGRHRVTGDGGKRGSLCQIPHPRWPPSGEDNFLCSTRSGGLRTLSREKWSARFWGKVMSKVQLKHTWKHRNREKFTALMKTVLLRILCLAPRSWVITQIQHSGHAGDRLYVVMKNSLRKLMAAETSLCCLNIDKNSKFLNVCLLGEVNNFLSESWSLKRSSIKLNLSLHLLNRLLVEFEWRCEFIFFSPLLHGFHLLKNQTNGSISVSGQLCTYPSLTQQ